MPRRRVLIDTRYLTHVGGRSYLANLLRELDRDPGGTWANQKARLKRLSAFIMLSGTRC